MCRGLYPSAPPPVTWMLDDEAMTGRASLELDRRGLAETADLLKLETIISLDSDEVKTDVTLALDSNPVNLVSHIPAGLSIRCERKRRAKSNDG